MTDVVLRPVEPADDALLRRVYASTREEELAHVPWTDEQRAAFLSMQYEAQAAHYAEYYPGASYDVIEVGGEPAGRLWVYRDVDRILVTDIAILPEFRGRGIGELLLRDVLAEGAAKGQSVHIQVEKQNRARNLYTRLGFTLVSEGPVYDALEWRPS